MSKNSQQHQTIMEECVEQGRKAMEENLLPSANPHRRRSSEYHAWRSGYYDDPGFMFE